MKININNYRHREEEDCCQRPGRNRHFAGEILKGASKCVSCPMFPELVLRIMKKFAADEKDKYGDNQSFSLDKVYPDLEELIREVREDQKLLNRYISKLPFRKQGTTGITPIIDSIKKDRLKLHHEDLLTLRRIDKGEKGKMLASLDVYLLFLYYVENHPDEYLDIQEYIQETDFIY